MKKFMTIAMIVLAAAMLVVSCEGQKKIDALDHSVTVEASIGIAQSKRLTVSGEKNKISYYKVFLEPLWRNEDVNDEIFYGFGDYLTTSATNAYTTDTSTPDDLTAAHVTGSTHTVKAFRYTTTTDTPTIDLGYLSQGQWKIDVAAFNENNALLYNATTSVYFTTVNKNANIVLQEMTATTERGKLYVNFTSTELTTGTDVKAKIILDGPTTGTDVELDLTTATDGKIRATKTIENLKPGTYKYTINLYRPGTTDVIIGGTVGTVYVSAEDNTTNTDAMVQITGQLLPSDFVYSNITVTVNTLYGYTTSSDVKLTAATTPTDDRSWRATVSGRALTTGVDYTFEFVPEGPMTENYETRSIAWYVDGDVEHPVATTMAYTAKFSVPGDHVVSYVATYTKNGVTAKYGEQIQMQVRPAAK